MKKSGVLREETECCERDELLRSLPLLHDLRQEDSSVLRQAGHPLSPQ